MVYYSSYYFTDRPIASQPEASLKGVVETPLDQHDYHEECDRSSGFWTATCYTCNKFFTIKPTFNETHTNYYNGCSVQYDNHLKRLARAAEANKWDKNPIQTTSPDIR